MWPRVIGEERAPRRKRGQLHRAEFGMGDLRSAEQSLSQFLVEYQKEDAFRESAKRTLAKIRGQ